MVTVLLRGLYSCDMMVMVKDGQRTFGREAGKVCD